MRLREIEEKCAEIRNEFGESDGVIPGELEPTWLSKITGIEFDHDRQVTVFTCEPE